MFKSINGGILPCRSTRHSAGFDVYSNEDAVIGAGETKTIGLGIALDEDAEWNYSNSYLTASTKTVIEDNRFYFALHIRSSLRAKGLTSLGTGIIDMDYRDEIKMVIHNPITDSWNENYPDGTVDKITHKHHGSWGACNYEIKKGDKIGQLILCRHEGWLLPSEYTKDEERVSGFGSTGER